MMKTIKNLSPILETLLNLNPYIQSIVLIVFLVVAIMIYLVMWRGLGIIEKIVDVTRQISWGTGHWLTNQLGKNSEVNVPPLLIKKERIEIAPLPFDDSSSSLSQIEEQVFSPKVK
jgi:hypothetical protein